MVAAEAASGSSVWFASVLWKQSGRENAWDERTEGVRPTTYGKHDVPHSMRPVARCLTRDLHWFFGDG